jgi:hypothetical protein
MSTLRIRCAVQTEAGGIAADGQRVELSDHRFEGKGRVHAIGNQSRAVSVHLTGRRDEATLIAA